MLFHGLNAVDVSSCAGLAAVQGLTVALPSVGEVRPRLRWLWLAPPVLFAALVLLLAAHPQSAGWLTGLAVVGVPVLATLAAVRLARGSRPAWALAVPVLLAASLSGPDHLGGQIGITLLCALSAVALGAGLVRLGGPRGVSIGLVALAVTDVVLVNDGRVNDAAEALAAAHIGHLPELSEVSLGTFSLGYGDLFVAGIAGAIAARRPSGQLRVAALTVVFMLLESAFLAGDGPYPATVPVVAALLLDEIVWRARGSRRAAGRARPGAAHPRSDLAAVQSGGPGAAGAPAAVRGAGSPPGERSADRRTTDAAAPASAQRCMAA
jgi:hypothetical protein